MTIHSVVIQKLLSTNAHLGRRVAANHFKIYTYGSRNAMTIIDSDKTLICLRNACDFIGKLVQNKGKFLFVNTNQLFDEIIEQMTQKIGCKNDNSWRLGGFLTNSSSPKKFRSRNKKLILGSTQPPDCVVIMDTQRKSSVILEADRLQIPIVGLVDSSMPWDIYKRITYPVPANDSVQFVYLFCNLITKTFLYEQKKKFPAALGNATQVEKAEIREATQRIEDSKTARDEIFVLPNESLVAASDDPVEIKNILDKLVVVKSNVDLDTKMDFNGAKSVIEVCNGLTCLDLIVNRIESLNSKYGCNIPLLLINSLNTHAATLKVLENHANKNIHTLIQSPHRGENDQGFMAPFYEGKNSGNELSPFDHSEVLVSLRSSGNLDVLLSQGKEYILMLNSDNLADVVDPKILNHLIQNNIEYCMEVMPTPSSNMEENALHPHKSKFKLWEIARMQVKQSDEKIKFTATTNLWLDMKAISRVVERGALENWNSPTLKYFDGAIGLKVPETRYLPVESTSDLLLFQSNLFTCSEGILTRNNARANSSLPSIELGPEFAKVSDFRRRFKSIPSIIDLDSLKVTGDVWFGTGISLKGTVIITAIPGMKLVIPDGALLENKMITSQRDI